MLKKGISFMVRRWTWMMPVLIKKFSAPTSNKVVGCRKDDWLCNKFVENLPLILVDFVKVRQHVEHDLAPLFIAQGLCGRSTCSPAWPFEKAKGRFILVLVVPSGWIMHARKVLIIVCCCEV